MFSLVLVVIGFIILVGVIFVAIEAYNAPFMEDVEMTVLNSRKRD